jgi:hypothetical protein
MSSKPIEAFFIQPSLSSKPIEAFLHATKTVIKKTPHYPTNCKSSQKVINCMEEPQTAGSQSGGTQILLPAFLQPSLSCNNKTKISNFEGLFSNKVHKKREKQKKI